MFSLNFIRLEKNQQRIPREEEGEEKSMINMESGNALDPFPDFDAKIS